MKFHSSLKKGEMANIQRIRIIRAPVKSESPLSARTSAVEVACKHLPRREIFSRRSPRAPRAALIRDFGLILFGKMERGRSARE